MIATKYAMRYYEIITETYRVITRDRWNNEISGSKLLDDPSIDKLIVKWEPSWKDSRETLAVFNFDEEEYPRNNSFYIILHGTRSFSFNESYNGEVISILRFLIHHWPQYADAVNDQTGLTMRDLAQKERPTLTKNTQWFHGTSSTKAAMILRTGLTPQTIDKRLYKGIYVSLDGVVYLTSNKDIAMMHAKNSVREFGGAPTILKIDLTGLEDRIINDSDIIATNLAKPSSHVDVKRIQKRPGEASFLTLETIAYRGRIPPNRISIVFQGKETKRTAKIIAHANQLQFVQNMGRLAANLSKDDMTTFFTIIAARPSGWMGRTVKYSDDYYADPARVINSVYGDKNSPTRFSQWLRGMQRRAGRWRKSSDGTKRAILTAINTELETITKNSFG